MKKMMIGIFAGLLIATAVGAYQADEKKSQPPMGGMMHGIKGMMGEQSQDMMTDMKEMRARMSKMMDMCRQMMGGSRSNQPPAEKK
jgi:Spy/CpxP family protein refolding chaperone